MQHRLNKNIYSPRKSSYISFTNRPTLPDHLTKMADSNEHTFQYCDLTVLKLSAVNEIRCSSKARDHVE